MLRVDTIPRLRAEGVLRPLVALYRIQEITATLG